MLQYFRRPPAIPVVKITGPIGMASPLSPGVSLSSVAGPLARAFKAARSNAVAIVINSPGGSPVQSRLIFGRIRDLAAERKKRVYTFCEDVAASGGYMIALAGDEIYADSASIVGSIGVISAGFGFTELMDKVGVERRLYTAGERKRLLDPFQPEDPRDVEDLKEIQQEIHNIFKEMVRERRKSKLNGHESEMFEGQIFLGERATQLGLIDGVGTVRSKMREVFGDKVKLKLIRQKRGLLRRMTGGVEGPAPNASVAPPPHGHRVARTLVREAIAAGEERMLWARFGL